MRKRAWRSVVTGAGAALLFGAWAIWANRAYDLERIVRAALTQAALSYASTVFAVLILERLFRLGRSPAARLGLAGLGTPAIILIAMAGFHWIAGTPALVSTIFPSVAIGTAFCITYTLGLFASERRLAAERAPMSSRRQL